MKSWKRAVTVALCAASLLAGCGGDCGLSDDDSADEPQITLEQLRAANDQRSLLEKHDTVTVTVQESDQNDAVTYTAKFQYQAERNVMNEVLFSTDSTEDVCDLTYFYPAPGSEKGWDVGENGWSVSEIRVAHGTRILFLDSADLALYADRELTKPIDFYDGVDTSGESATVYIVPLEENH